MLTLSAGCPAVALGTSLTGRAGDTGRANLALLTLRAGGTLSAGRPHRANGTIESGQAGGTGRPDLALQAPEALLALDALSAGCTAGVALRTGRTDRADGTGRANLTLSAGGAVAPWTALRCPGCPAAPLEALRTARAHRAGRTVEPGRTGSTDLTLDALGPLSAGDTLAPAMPWALSALRAGKPCAPRRPLGSALKRTWR